ncbi:MAG: trimethylamine methyltransferase family protein [Actinobacteria bacterium]|nr:trimethylamine methyltransferase family protein [Actinomycetota bacterium]
MRPFTGFLKMLTLDELEKLHDNAVSLLENPGMKIENEALLKSLSRAGAKVDFEAEIARIPKKLTDEIIALAAAEEKERMAAFSGSDFSETDIENKLTYSWHSPFRNSAPKIEASFGGGAPLFYDHKKGINRYATKDDFINMVNLAQALPEIVTVGNAVHYVKENDGSDLAPKMVAIKGAALVAKHSSKPGCTTIIDRRQLPYLMEMGRIVKGSASRYIKSPVFVNIHDTETLLRLTRPEAAIIEAMAKNNLCISILPMPLVGISTPIFPVSAAIVGTAEILAVWAAVKTFNNNCAVEANCVSGVLNPATGTACFAAPEAVMADLAVGQLFRQKYGVPCGLGVGLIDAPVPGLLSVYERIFKSTASTLAGEPSFPVGIIGGAVVFSMEQVILDLDIAANQRQLIKGIGQKHFDSSLELIRERGIGGLFIDTRHTAANFRDNLTFRHALINLKSTSVSEAIAKDPVQAAHNRCIQLLENVKPYLIDEDRERAIDEVVNRASEELSALTGAME